MLELVVKQVLVVFQESRELKDPQERLVLVSREPRELRDQQAEPVHLEKPPRASN